MKSASDIVIAVPYYSQYRDVTDDSWKARACGAVCLKMVLEYFGRKRSLTVPSIDELIQEGIAIKATSEAGWVHTRIALLAHNHGFPAYNEEFRSVAVNYEKQRFSESEHAESLMRYGITKIAETVRAGRPVIVSVSKRFEHKELFHQVVLTGIRGSGAAVEGFFYNDPDHDSPEEGTNRFVDLATFREHWRRFAIFVA